MPIQLWVLVANSILLFLCFVLAIVMLRAGVKHNLNMGDPAVQIPLRRRIMKIILAYIVIGLVAIAINMVSALFN